MAVLFDLFSYRVKNSSDGLYFDRWHGNTFPGIGMSFIEQLLPQFSGQEIPSLFFDEILSKQFNAAKMSKKLQAKFGF